MTGGIVDARKVVKYPAPLFVAKDVEIGDSFNRESIQPTNANLLYTTTLVGAGSIAIVTRSYARLTTGAVAADDVSTRTSELAFDRTDTKLTDYTIIEVVVLFRVQSPTDTEVFIGLLNAGSITALPTTTEHMGVYCDLSVGPNFILSSANGAAQATTNTGQAVDASSYVLRIRWTGTNAAVITLETIAGVVIATHTVVALAGSLTAGLPLHFFIDTEAVAAKNLDIFEWRALPT